MLVNIPNISGNNYMIIIQVFLIRHQRNDNLMRISLAIMLICMGLHKSFIIDFSSRFKMHFGLVFYITI